MSEPVRQSQNPKKRIVLFESDNLFMASVASQLQKQSDLEVISTSFGILNGMDELAQMAPDVLILEDRVMSEHLEELVQFIEKCPRLRAIVLNSNSNRIQVFDEEILQVSQIGDFLEVLRWPGRPERP